MDGVIKKKYAALGSLLQYACPKHYVNIAVHRADVASCPIRDTFLTVRRLLRSPELTRSWISPGATSACPQFGRVPRPTRL